MFSPAAAVRGVVRLVWRRLIWGLPSMVPAESDVCMLVALELGLWPHISSLPCADMVANFELCS